MPQKIPTVDPLNQKTSLLRESGRIAILNSVAAVLADGGLAMSMGDVAEAAGVGRATLYRYFPNRKILLESIRDQSLLELGTLIHSSNKDGVETKEALGRIARSVLTQAGISLLLIRERVVFDKQILEETLFQPLDKLFTTVQQNEQLLPHIPVRTITLFFIGLLRTGSSLVAEEVCSTEETASYIIKLIFDGFGNSSK